MDKKFLNKVVEQIVRETEVWYDRGMLIKYPWSSFYETARRILTKDEPSWADNLVIKHFRSVYGLNEEEIEYVWEEYRIKLYKKVMSSL